MWLFVVVILIIIWWWWPSIRRLLGRDEILGNGGLLDKEDALIEDINVRHTNPLYEEFALQQIYAEYNKALETEEYGNAEPEFVFIRAEGFLDNAHEWFGVEMEPFPTLPARKAKQTMKRLDQAKGKNKKEKTKSYMKAIQTHTDDRQNVHDSGVNKDMRRTYEIIVAAREENTATEGIDDILKYIEKSDLSILAKERATKTAQKMAEQLNIASLKADEGDILVNVWNRAYHPSNLKNRDLIKDSVIFQLSDCWEHGRMVCGGGRTGRVIGALVTLDSNKSVGSAITREAHKNEIIADATKIFDEELAKFEKSDDADKKMYAKSFVDPTVDDEKIGAAVKEELKVAVMTRVDAVIAKHDVPPTVRAEIEMGLGLD